MHRLVLLLLLPGCELFFDATPAHNCETYTGTIFEPADEATVPTTMQVRIRWNQPNIPDRYSSMSDDFGNFFIPKDYETLGDGSTRNTYDLPAAGHFNFEIGWFCDAGNDGPEIKLAQVRIHTQ